MRYVRPSAGSWQLADRKGRQGKKNEKTTYICASSQIAKKSACVPFFFFFKMRFWAFLGKLPGNGTRTRHEKNFDRAPDPGTRSGFRPTAKGSSKTREKF
jgi:hypothetical protein